MNTIIAIETPTCFVCNERGVVNVDQLGYNQWRNGWLIQDAFPQMPKELREQLKSGIHPTCWNSVFGGGF